MAFSLAAQPDGYVSFQVNQGVMNIVEQSGIIYVFSLKDTGIFGIELTSGSPHFQVTLSNDKSPVDWNIAERSGSNFEVRIFTLSGSPFNPQDLCTITVERLPAE